jgi:hypothetical protein
MRHARVEYQLEGDQRIVTYEESGAGEADFPPVPVLLVEVRDAEDADALALLIEKHDRAAPQKPRKRAVKDTTPAAAVAVPATSPGTAARGQEDSPKCVRPGCLFDADKGDTCRDDADASETDKAAWRAARAKPKALSVAHV